MTRSGHESERWAERGRRYGTQINLLWQLRSQGGPATAAVARALVRRCGM